MDCRIEMINRGERLIPRSCPECGLGGCKKGLPDPWRPVAPANASVQPMTEVYVLVRSSTYEGHDPPLRVFANQKQADAAASMLSDAGAPGEWHVYAMSVEPAP